ncbi:hypothetical protein BDB00DRAFT_397649 [Zychaea mexicana]|uniref:uncharacterized protein n=1 Tax=Zychaea mexicana TaxID=64656 RepID=UPI0022FDC852|nr:uncharacterized protein BDB00DRAFT_397649 [Zychaea mexicana]KAI9498687.1 hypothetical protein BDB00DRAFT_397649 [Zychaea mexicana]
MSKLTQTPPLISLNPGPIGPLQVRVHEPFRQRQGLKKTRAVLNVLDLFGRLELILKKQQHMQRFQPPTEQAQSLEKLDAEPQENDYIQEMKLAALYPLATQHLKCTTPTERAQRSIVGADIYSHYHQMALYDQLYAIAARLYRSLNLPDHHYIPYQLAVAFQCITQLGMYYTEFRERIQRRFEEIKSTLSKETPTLNEEQVLWLKKLTKDLMVQVLYGKNNTDPTKSNRHTLLTEAMVQTQKISQRAAASPVV